MPDLTVPVLTSPTLIIGLHVDVPGAELKDLLDGRLRHHEQRLTGYQKQFEDMRKLTQELDEEAAKITKTSMRSPLESIEEAIRKHQNQMVYYRFMASHVNIQAIYRLSEADLVRLGIQADRGY